MTQTKWWHNEVIYQVYPRSFQDSNGDGIGDLQGIISRLDYLQDLGVTMIWLSPIFKSPMVDMGYDISDYQDIDPQFGTMADFDELLAETKRRGIKIILDLVVNHTSDQHDWFQQALADPTSKYRDYYIFKTTADGKEPNNWRGIFGGSTWTAVPNEPGTYFFHTFAPEQPELNWENPALRREIYDMINWWLEKGIAGWRVDAITHLKKDLDWASIEADGDDGLANVIKKGQNRPGIDDFLLELKQETFDKYGAFTIGEAYGVPDEDLAKYIGDDGYFSTIFDFSYMNIDVRDVNDWYLGQANWTTADLKRALFHAQDQALSVDAYLATVLENHDQPRVLSKLVSDPQWQTPQAAKALATMYFLLRGVPLIYQGQEIGMKNFHRQSMAEFNDVSSLDNYRMAIAAGFSEEQALASVNAKSRDNARVPMQWDDSQTVGFTTGTPWLKIGDDRAGISVAEEINADDSTLTFYRDLVALRQNERFHDLFVAGDLVEVSDVADDVVAFDRVLGDDTVHVRVNLGTQTQSVAGTLTDLILTNSELTISDDVITLAPYQAVVYR